MNQFYKAYAVAIASLLTGAAVVHNIYKPDLRIPMSKPNPSDPITLPATSPAQFPDPK
ncbi:TPA: hypothetical protein ACH3X3_001010 [Trebouxia sp. C0006]